MTVAGHPSRVQEADLQNWLSEGPEGLSNFIFGILLIEPADFPLMRKCMLGVKRRAEARSLNTTAGSV